jgi:hypothetical protein
MSGKKKNPQSEGSSDPSVRRATDPHARVAGQPHQGTDLFRDTKNRQAEIFSGDTTGDTSGTQARLERIFEKDRPSSLETETESS